MKRKRSEVGTKDRARDRRSSLRCLSEVRSSANCSDSSISRETEDIRRVKKVRFADPESVNPLSCKYDACLINAKEPLPSRFADPKTSEYTFYKKLREDAGRNSNSYQLLKQRTKLKKSEGYNHIRELNKIVKPNHEEFRSLFPFEMATPIELNSLSPPGASMTPGLDGRDESIFSRKRQRLLQLAALSSNLDIDEYQSKGYELVSILLQRLVPEGNSIASNSCVEPRSRNMSPSDKSQLLVSPAPHIHFKGLPHHARISTSPFAVRYLKNCSPECLPNREIIFSRLDTMDSNSLLTGRHNKFHLQYERRKPEKFIDVGRATCLQTPQKSVFGVDPSTEFSFPSFGHLTLTPSRLVCSTCKNLFSCAEFPEKSLDLINKSSFEKLDGLHDANEPAFRSELFAPQLLGWDNNIKKEQDLLIPSHNEAADLNPDWRIPFENWDSEVGPTRLCSESGFATWHCPDLNACNFCSASCPIHVAGREVKQKENCQLVEPDNSLTLSCTSNYLGTPAERCQLSGKHEGRSAYCSAHDSYKFMSELFEEKVFPNLDSLLFSSKQGFHFGWKGLPITDCIGEHTSFIDFNAQSLIKDIALLTGDITEEHVGSSSKTTGAQFTKEMISIYDFSSFNFRVSLHEERAWPLLVDKSSWDRSEGACTYSEDH